MIRLNHAAVLLGTALFSMGAHAYDVNVTSCDDLFTAMKDRANISLGNDIDCNNREMLQAAPDYSYWPETVEGNGFTIKNLVVTSNSGLFHSAKTIKDINFDGIRLQYSGTTGQYNNFGMSLLGSRNSGSFMQKVKLTNIESREPINRIFEHVSGTVDNVKVVLGKNNIMVKGAFLAQQVSGNMSNVRVKGGTLTYQTSNPVLGINQVLSSASITNIKLKNQKVEGDISGMSLVSGQIKGYINGFTFHKVKIANPDNPIALITNNELYSKDARVLNVHHDFWAESEEPLFPNVIRAYDNGNYYEVYANAVEPKLVPLQCAPYLKQDYYWLP